MKSGITSEITIGEYIAGFNICDDLMIMSKNRVNNTWSLVASTRKSSAKKFTCLQIQDMEVFICTGKQLVYEKKKDRYIHSDQINRGDILCDVNAQEHVVTRTYTMGSDEIVDVYSLITSDNKPYYINNILTRT